MASSTMLISSNSTCTTTHFNKFKFSTPLKSTNPTSISISQLGFVTSQFTGLKISQPLTFPPLVGPTLNPSLKPLIVARRVCPFTGKKSNNANKVSFSNHKTKRLQFVNLQYKKVWWEAGNRFVKLRLSTKALKTIEKNGLDAVAKKAGINLSKL